MTDKLQGRKTLKVTGILEEFEKDKIKGLVDIVSLFSSFGVELKQKGSSFIGQCPWHEDSTPSLSVNRENGLYNCFGCGESGDAFTLVQKMKNIGFSESVAYLKGLNGTVQVKQNVKPKPSVARKSSPVAPQLTDLVVHWQSRLAESSEAREYLISRGLTDGEIWKRFRIGYSDGSLSEKLSNEQKSSLIPAGIINSKGEEVFAHHIIIPLLNPETGTPTGLYGRAVRENVKPAHRYLKGPRKGLVNHKALSVYRERIIITESIIDCLSLIQAGVQNVIPSYGTSGLSDEMIARFKSERVKEVVVAFDRDEAGISASSSVVMRFRSEGVKAVSVCPPDGHKDWNSLLVSGGLSRESFSALVDSAAAVEDPEAATDEGEQEKPESLSAAKDGGVWTFTISSRRYRALGVKDVFVSSLKINLRLTTHVGKYLDNVDLYSARSRSGYASGCAAMTGVEAAVAENDLLSILEHLEGVRNEAMADSSLDESTHQLTDEERELGREFLSSPDLFDRIVSDTETLGYGGEDVNKLLVYLAASSRKLDDPISVIVVSESASGKSFLVDTVKKLIPDEDVLSMTSLSDQALQYLPPDALLHKFLVMGEAVHGMTVEHQVREMLSAKELRRLVTQKDPKTGEMASRMVSKKVIVSAVMSSTNPNINPENASRSFVINTDESSEHTRRIHELQRKKYSLERYREKETVIPDIIRTHHAAQRMLVRVRIVNPFASLLDFPITLMRSRRDHERFIDLIAVVSFLRQYQKEKRIDEEGTEFIECDLTDYQVAYRIMKHTLPSTLTSFPRHAHDLYERLRDIIRAKAKDYELSFAEVTVTQREIREATGLSQMSVKRSLRTLSEWEYVLVSGGGMRGMRNGYRMLEDTPLKLVDLSMIPSPSAMKAKLQKVQSGSTGSHRVKSGSDPLRSE